MPRLRFALPAVLTLAMLMPVSAASAADERGLTQSATPALACLTETPVTGCATETEFMAGNGTIDVASFGDDTYVLRGFPNTAFQDNGLFRVRRQGDAYVIAQCFTLTLVPGCTQTGLISNATSIAASDQRVYLATSFPNNTANGTVGGVTVIPRNPTTGALTAPTACRSSVATLAAPTCVTGDPIGTRATGIAVTPDGDGLYVTGAISSGSTVLGYDLAPDGDLDTAPSCLASVATTGCTISATPGESAAVNTAGAIDVTDDGEQVLIATERGITSLDRDVDTNDVAFASCLSNLPAADVCDPFPAGLRFPVQIKHSETDTFTTVTAEISGPGGDFPGAVLLLERDPGTAELSVTSCLSSAATAGCTAYGDLNDPSGITIDPDGAAVYVSGENTLFGGRVLTLAITGSDLSVLPGTDGCLQAGAATATCAGGARGLDNVAGPPITLSADGADVVVGSLDGVAFLTRAAIDPVDPEPPVVVTGVAQPKPAATTRLDKKRGFTVPVQCTGDTACSGKLTVASAGKIKVKPGGKAKVVTFATAPYAVPKGKTVVVKLKVSAANTKAIARLRKVKSVVSAKSKAGVVRKANTTLVGKKKKK